MESALSSSDRQSSLFVMKIIIPLIASTSVCLVSCRESTTRMSSDEGASKEALQALEAKLADLENEILREKNERLEKEARQRRLLLEIKEMVAEAKAPEEKSKTVVEKVTPAPVANTHAMTSPPSVNS